MVTDEGYSQIVLKAEKDVDLFTLDALLSMCRIEHELIRAPGYKDLCVHTTGAKAKCCRPWSLGNYIALIHNRTSCLALTVS